MINNIIAQFASSVWKSSESSRAATKGFSVGDLKEYRVVSGSVFNEEYSETLDSATLVLSQVAKEDRLANIKPYDYVRVFDKTSYDSSTGKYNFDKLYLVDNFDEKENNIKEHIFGYTINLMSETKLLEKIQCPNLTITHDIKNGVISKKTIYEHIQQYMELFVPKIKFSDGELLSSGSTNKTWNYRPLITIDSSEEFYDRFNVPCADMNFAAPTLRQLLTMLMQQVGCIPIVRNRVLSFLDFQKNAVPFAANGDYSLGNTVNFIRKSLSSDSYVNTLVNLSDNVLDSENEVICETLCFRDNNNVLLKQTENLSLETSLPIYKVNKCILRAPGKITGYLCSSLNCFYGYPAWQGNEWNFTLPTSSQGYPFICYKEAGINGTTATIKFRFSTFPEDAVKIIRIGTIYFWNYDSTTGKYTVAEERNVDLIRLTNSNITRNDSLTYYGMYDEQLTPYTFSTFSYTLQIQNLPSGLAGFFFKADFELYNSEEDADNLNGTVKQASFIRFADSDPRIVYHDVYEYKSVNEQNGQVRVDHPWSASLDADNRFVAAVDLHYLIGVQSWDITKLVVENSVRQLLDTDFLKMVGNGINGDPNENGELSNPNTWTIDNISKYIYGTVGYEIGSKKISGFSDVFYIGEISSLGWVTKNYTYLENIIKVLEGTTSQALIEVFDIIYSVFEGLNLLSLLQGDYNPPVPVEGQPGVYETDLPTLETHSIASYAFDFFNTNTGEFDSYKKFFTSFFVDLYYQPLNSFNMSYVKKDEDVALPLAQYDGNASGLTDFDRLSIHEQEQVDRIGNETLSISQRTTDYSQIRNFNNGPLIFRDDVNRNGEISEGESVDYIIFKRSFTINNNCYNVSYVGSKDAVLKDYFTSIRTKYRAYQYVNYSQSVLRKEKDLFYIRIASNRYDGDDRVNLGPNNNTGNQFKYITNFMYDLDNDKDKIGNARNVSYEIETDTAKVHSLVNSSITTETQTIKNSVSAITTKNCLAFIYQYMDNVGAGPYIADITNNANLGGVPQSWQIWDGYYNDQHNVTFSNYIGFYEAISDFITQGTLDYVAAQIRKIEKSPIVDDSFRYEVSFSIVDNNRSGIYKRTFYKDNSECINHTVQFIYYSPYKDVLFGENFVAGAPVINRFTKGFNRIILTDEFSLKEEPYYPSSSEVKIKSGFYGTYGIRLVTGSLDYPKLEVSSWYGGKKYNVVKMCHYENGQYIDIAAFYLGGMDSSSKDFYFMINDTKTDYVYGETNGVLFLKYKVNALSTTLLSLLRSCKDNF